MFLLIAILNFSGNPVGVTGNDKGTVAKCMSGYYVSKHRLCWEAIDHVSVRYSAP